jgi:uncharacterized protein YegP (UPF0339 family)
VIKFKIKRSGVQWYFDIVANNYKTLASSERYHNKQDAVHAAYLIINGAGGGTIEEE